MDSLSTTPFKTRLRVRPAGVRVVAKVRAAEIGVAPQVSVLNGDSPAVVFADQASSRKDSYKMDWCYGQDDGADEIFSREVKPLLQGVCHGRNAAVISYGPRGSGKTQMIQGSEENPGLAPMAVSEILLRAMEIGGSVAISCYEVCQDHVYDLLEPKEQEVLVLEDFSKKVQLKGLSQVPVKSLSDFNKLYFESMNQGKQAQKNGNDVTTRSHRGLIVYVTSADAKKPNLCLVGKMNFVDLAGYEDVKKSSSIKPQLAESAKVNKSLYALLNVVSALNSDESYVSYRECKLTRLLQDSLCGGNGAVLITCLNSTISQDTIHAVSLASRSCKTMTQHLHGSAKCSKSNSKLVTSDSHINGSIEKKKEATTPLIKRSISKLVASSPRINRSVEKKKEGGTPVIKRRTQTLPNSAQRPTFTLSRLNENKASRTPKMVKERKRFNIASSTPNTAQDIFSLNASTSMNIPKKENDLSVDPFVAEEDIFSFNTSTSMNIPKKENDLSVDPSVAEEGISPQKSATTVTTPKVQLLDIFVQEKPLLHCSSVGSSITEEEFCVSNVNSVEPSVLEKDELSSQLVNLSIPQVDKLCSRQLETYHVEPKTPEVSVQTKVYYNSTFENVGTPQEMLEVRSTGLKKTLVHECLTFLNTASKEDLKMLKGIGEKRAAHILKLREIDVEPFKEISNIKKELGLTSKQIKEMITMTLGDFSG